MNRKTTDSQDLVVLSLTTKLVDKEEVFDKILLSIQSNDDYKKYYFDSIEDYHTGLNKIRPKDTKYTIFVNNLTKLYVLDKKLQKYTHKSFIGCIVYARDNKDRYRNMQRYISDGTKELDISHKRCEEIIKYIMQYYEKVEEVPKSIGRIEKDRLQNKIMFDNEWIKFANLTRVADEEMFQRMKSAKTGGLFGNCKPKNYIIKDCISYDVSSAYPAVMLSQKFPIGMPSTTINPDMEKCSRFLKEKQYLISFKVTNPINIGKAKLNYDFREEVTMTNDVFDVFRNLYIWDEIEYTRLYVWNRSEYLPKTFREYLIDLYKDKNRLEKGTIEYDYAKVRLNLWYGLGLQFLTPSSLKSAQSHGIFYIPPVIGLWTVGYQIKRMNNIIDKIDYKNLVKFDTDSITFTHDFNSVHFTNDNQNMEKILYNIYRDTELSNNLGIWKLEYKDDIVIFGNKQYGLVKANEIKLAGCLLDRPKDDENVVLKTLKTRKIENGTVRYDAENQKIKRGDYHINSDMFNIVTRQWH